MLTMQLSDAYTGLGLSFNHFHAKVQGLHVEVEELFLTCIATALRSVSTSTMAVRPSMIPSRTMLSPSSDSSLLMRVLRMGRASRPRQFSSSRKSGADITDESMITLVFRLIPPPYCLSPSLVIAASRSGSVTLG